MRRGLGFCLASDSSLLRIVNGCLWPNLLLNARLGWQLVVDGDALRFCLQLARQGLVQTLRCHIFDEFVAGPLQRVLMDLDRWESDWLDGSLSIELDLAGDILAEDETPLVLVIVHLTNTVSGSWQRVALVGDSSRCRCL